MLGLGKGLQRGEAVSHGNGWQPSMQRYGDDKVAHHRQPPETCVCVLAEEGSHRLMRSGGRREGGGGRGEGGGGRGEEGGGRREGGGGRGGGGRGGGE